MIQLLNFFGTITQWVNRMNPVTRWLTVVGLLLVFCVVLIKAIKINYNPKDTKKVNVLWFILAAIIFIVVILLAVL